MPASQVAAATTPAPQPHVNEVRDFPTQQALRIANDRIQALTNRLAAAEATITQLLSVANAAEAAATAAQKAANEALAITQQP